MKFVFNDKIIEGSIMKRKKKKKDDNEDKDDSDNFKMIISIVIVKLKISPSTPKSYRIQVHIKNILLFKYLKSF